LLLGAFRPLARAEIARNLASSYETFPALRRLRREGGTLAHPRCATRQARAPVRQEGREGEGQRATDLGGLAAQNDQTGQR
jgi:hypothetical protein